MRLDHSIKINKLYTTNFYSDPISSGSERGLNTIRAEERQVQSQQKHRVLMFG